MIANTHGVAGWLLVLASVGGPAAVILAHRIKRQPKRPDEFDKYAWRLWMERHYG